MTTPTQAQIEAAAKAIEKQLAQWFASRLHSDDAKIIAEAALTAAAQVGAQSHIVDDLELPIERSERKEIVLREDMNKAIVATIERCAQVAEDHDLAGRSFVSRTEIAAAIRKLKDEAHTAAQ